MPLRDHFRPPLSPNKRWESFHATWATMLTFSLNEVLPPGFEAAPTVHLGPRVEVDVLTVDEIGIARGRYPADVDGGVATLAPPEVEVSTADFTLPLTFDGEFAVQLFSETYGLSPVAAIELVSPANKDRPDTRATFAAKCAGYLQQGMSLIVIDIVTERKGRPLIDLLDLLPPDEVLDVPDNDLSAVAYRPMRRGGVGRVEVRARRLAIGEPLPSLPLWLDAVQRVAVDFEGSYMRACRGLRIE